jgi:alpha-amylase
MDYETFGEHQWESTGIFDFLTHLPSEWLKNEHHTFMTVSEAADAFEPVDYVDVPNTITWADTERDLSPRGWATACKPALFRRSTTA